MVRRVTPAVRRDLKALAELDPDLAKGGLALTAVVLAESIDSEHSSAAEKASCARALLATLDELRALAPAERAGDTIDDLAKRRELRLAANE